MQTPNKLPNILKNLRKPSIIPQLPLISQAETTFVEPNPFTPPSQFKKALNDKSAPEVNFLEKLKIKTITRKINIILTTISATLLLQTPLFLLTTYHPNTILKEE